MAIDAANALSGGGDGTGVWVAPKGSTPPAAGADPTAPWVEIGWLADDGVSWDRSEDRKVIRGHQGGAVVKRLTASVDDTIKFVALETNAATVGLQFKGATATVATGVATYHVADQTHNDERAFFVREVMDDGSYEEYVVPNGSTESGGIVYKTDELTAREFTLGINGDYDYRTNVLAVTTPA